MQTAAKIVHVEQVNWVDLFGKMGLPSEGIPLHEAIQKGLPYALFEKISSMLGIDKKDLATFTQMAPATLARRAKSGTFSADESDRLITILTTIKAAIELYDGNAKYALEWLLREQIALGGNRPVEMLSTRVGAGTVMDLIGRIEHGICV